jgi:cell division protein FtsA
MAALQADEREEGVVLMDIGAGTTEILVIREGTARHADVLPLGGANVTRDLAIGLNISQGDAERLKLDHARVEPAPPRRGDAGEYPIRQVGQREDRFVTASTLASIVEPRIQELLELAWERARRSPEARRPATSVVLCGGGALLPGLPEMAAQLYERSVRLAGPLAQEGLTAELQDPRYTPVVGLLHYGYQRLGLAPEPEGARGGLLRRIFKAGGKRAG